MINSNSQKQSNPMIDMLISIVIPSVILMKFSGEEEFGAVNALLIALAFPIGWGLFELFKYKKLNLMAVLGLVSVLLTGGIGLLQLDLQWLAIKEAAIPGILGLAVLISTRTRYPLVRTLLYNPSIMNVEKIHTKLEELENKTAFESRLLNANYLLSGTFFFSSLMNYLLAKWVVTSPTGTSAFNEELGQMTLLSYPVIAIPSMLMMMAIFYYLWKTIHGMTGLSLEQILVSRETQQRDE